MMKNLRVAILMLVCMMGFVSTSCSDDITSTYSQKYRVMCGFQVVSYRELINVIGNFGQFATIRQSGDKIVMKTLQSQTSYNLDALSKDFRFGLGGIIVGTDNWGNYRAFDLACPNCDRNDYRLTLGENGVVTCGKCAIKYDLNNDGVILSKGNGTYESPRGLYRYPITYDGIRVNIIN